jgi:hypothetical protein
MTATILWSISALDCYPQVGDETDVVFVCHWTCAGTQTQDAKTYNASVYSTCSVPAPSGSSFTPYSQLTQTQVLGWIWANGVDQDVTEAAVQQQIDGQINPTVVTPPLPWATA